MLGLSNACSSSTYVPFSSTRSIPLDGSNDYLDTGRTFATTFAGAFSISLWIKPSDGQPSSAEVLFGSENADSEDLVWGRLETTGQILLYYKSNDQTVVGFKTDAAVFSNGAGVWKHIVFTAALSGSGNTTFAIYVDGSAVAATMTNSVTEAEHANFATDTNFYVGAKNDDGSLTSPFDGNIDEFAMWNSTLSANAITALYNNGNPTELTAAKGDYTAQANLVVWYRMGDGSFDDLDQSPGGSAHYKGFICDMHNPGFGSDLFDPGKGTFDSGTGAWYVAGSNTIANVDGQLVITYVDDVLGARVNLNNAADLSSDLTVGTTYMLQFDAKRTGGDGNQFIQVYWGSAESSFTQDLTESMYTYRLYFHARHATSSYMRMRDMSSGGTITLDNISLVPVNGYPAIVHGRVASFSDDFSNEFN